MELTSKQKDRALTQVNPALDQKVHAALTTAGTLDVTALLAALPGVDELALRQSLERLWSQGKVRPVGRETNATNAPEISAMNEYDAMQTKAREHIKRRLASETLSNEEREGLNVFLELQSQGRIYAVKYDEQKADFLWSARKAATA
jgi:hypothetical protein